LVVVWQGINKVHSKPEHNIYDQVYSRLLRSHLICLEAFHRKGFGHDTLEDRLPGLPATGYCLQQDAIGAAGTEARNLVLLSSEDRWTGGHQETQLTVRRLLSSLVDTTSMLSFSRSTLDPKKSTSLTKV
jgi:hypothetical protein